jgi:endoglycosylceramidase
MVCWCAAGLAAGADGRAGAQPAEEPARPLSFLHVGAAGGPSALPQVVDSSGRQVVLKGVNVDGLADYWRADLRTPYPIDPAAYADGACPPDDPTVEGVMVCDFDFAQMHPLGFNAIRLNISWSLLEPAPGQISQLYLNRIAQVVGWAHAQGIYMVLDLHQDAWSKYIYTRPGQTCLPPTQAIRGYDGAPEWASRATTPACALNGTREFDSAVQEQFQKLYSDAAAPDGVGFQEHYAHALAVLAQRFASDPTVAGYEIINEPSPGFNVTPGVVDASELFPFYGKVVNTVVHDVPGFRQLIFIEPNAERDVTDQSAIVTPWSAYSAYPNVVYAPHVYTGVFTLDQEATSQRFFPSDGGYRSAISDAQALGLPLWVGEFGNNPSNDETLLRTTYALQDRYGLGGALWLWKENANDVNQAVFWGVYGKPFGRGVPQLGRIKFVSRAFPLLVAGNLESFTYDPDRSLFDLRASSPPVAFGDRTHAALIFVPASSTGDVVAQGARLQVFARGPSREVYVYPTGGSYHVYQAPGTGSSGTGASPTSAVSLQAPPTSPCRSQRHLVIHVRARRGARLLGVRVSVNGQRLRGGKRIRRSSGHARIDLHGLPRGTYRVRVRVRVRENGRTRTFSLTRTYHTCARRRGRRRR